MKISSSGISVKSWDLDLINEKFNFTSKISKFENIFSIFSESFTILFILSFFLILLIPIFFYFFNNLYVYSILLFTSFILGILAFFAYFISSKFRYDLRLLIAHSLFTKKDIKQIKVTSIHNNTFRLCFKNYYLDVVRTEDFINSLTFVKCYPLFDDKSLYIAEFTFSSIPKNGYMLIEFV